MKLYYSPGACSMGIHVLLEEIGKPYQAVKVDFSQREQYGAPYTTGVSAKSKVPVLERDDGSKLTEFTAIAYYLAATNPAAGLMPGDAEGVARALETVDYVVATVHMQGFTRSFRPENFAADPGGHDAVKARGKEIIDKSLALLDKQLQGRDYAVGAYSFADAALYYVEYWRAIRMKGTLPPALDAHFNRMRARPAVAAALKAEGL